jgi:uncharacterized protein with PQ loop repeat
VVIKKSYEMELNTILDVAALTVSLSITLVGFPFQIWKNYKKKDASGVSYILFILSLLSYSIWTTRAYFRHDWIMVVAYVPGILFTGIILCQMYFYRKSP